MYQFQNIPAELRDYRQWVCWRYENRGTQKPTKTPYNPIDGRFAESNNPYTWTTFEQAISQVNNYDGLGFVLTANDPYCFVDFDETTLPDEVDHQIRLMNEFDSYSEVSPSGKGLHIICKGSVITGRRSGAIEIYSSGRYMTMTGNVYQDKPIAHRQHSVTNLWTQLGGNEARKLQLDYYNEFSQKTDLEIYDIAQYAANGEKFLRLWNGDTITYHNGDHSAADFALVDILAFYTQDREQIKRMFRTSALGKRKKAEREDYLELMISKSFDRLVPKIDLSAYMARVDQFMASRPIEVMKEAVDSISNRVEDIPVINPAAIIYKNIVDKEQEAIFNSRGTFPVPPGLVGDIAKFIYDQSYKPVTEISICGAIGLMAGIAGRAYNVSSTGLNMYLLLLAGTGRGKEAIATGIGKILKSVQPIMPTVIDFVGPQDMASGQGLLRYMSNHPTKSFVSIMGEFGIKLKQICDPRASSADLMTQKVFLDMFTKSGVAQTINPTVYSDSDKNTKAIDSPAFSLIGETAPTWFHNSLDENWIRTGLLPRFTIVEYSGLRPPSNYSSEKVVPSQSLISQICTLATIVQKVTQANIPLQVQLDAFTHDRSIKLDRECDTLINTAPNDILAELWSRCHLKVLKLAALLAVGKNPYAPTIDMECWNWAENFIRDGINRLCLTFQSDSYGADTVDEARQMRVVVKQIAKYLVDGIESARKYKINDAMYMAKVVPMSYLTNRLYNRKVFKQDKRGVTAAIRNTLQNLVDTGELQEIPRTMAQASFAFSGKLYAISGNAVFEAIENQIHLQADYD